ncbi:hypothetical protein MC7420_611 [Coleofasciculus chthonoplastes PCC 7420]|uniref:Uncharacterized protein n=1 Tax=Coleofasciculus chthonoplastes PCC 7420 TaxID=118168 RepID=B4VL96_9CYAN|nr:hypothetical protein MC7420_611 [Coleofasciculus chthonoplastes PCC 7420]
MSGEAGEDMVLCRGGFSVIRVNLSSTPHPQPLSHAGERGANGFRLHP